jgi:hypothetical protein
VLKNRQPFESFYVSDTEAVQAGSLFQSMVDELFTLHDPEPCLEISPEAPSVDSDYFYDDVSVNHGLAIRLYGAVPLCAVLFTSCSLSEPDTRHYSLDFFWRKPRGNTSEHLICTYNFNDEENILERTDWDSELLPKEIPRYTTSPQRYHAIQEQIAAGQNGLRVGAAEAASLRGTLSMGTVIVQ